MSMKLDRVLILMLIGLAIVGMANSLMCQKLATGIEVLQKEIHLSDENMTVRCERIEELIVNTSSALQLGTLTSEEAAKMNLALAQAMAANAGCRVSLQIDSGE